MKSSASLLIPFLRSDTQGRILAELALDPESEWTVTALAERAEVSVPTAMREVNRLVDFGLASDRRIGNARLVTYRSAHPIADPVRRIVLYGYGPVAVLPRLIRSVTGVDEAYLYGSWAARYAGEAGSDAGDVDVLLVGDVDGASAYAVASEATRMLGREVNVNILTPERWAGDDGFVHTVKSRPLIRIDSEA